MSQDNMQTSPQVDSGREKVVRSIAGRLSLRQPQTESLEILHKSLEAVPALRNSTLVHRMNSGRCKRH